MSLGKLLAMMLVCLITPLLEGQYPRTRRGIATGSGPAAYKGLVVTFHGALKKLTKKEILIESDDNQLLTMRCSRKTRFEDRDGDIKPSDIDLESRVSVDASEDVDLKLLAIEVTVDAPNKKALGK